MNIPLIDLHAQYLSFGKEALETIEKVLESGIYISGTEVSSFEKEIAAFTGTKFAVSTANGTDALVLALQSFGIGPGDEVITTPYTFFASAEAIARCGAVPVFADIDEKTYNLSPEQVEAKITAKTKAIIPVHLFGHPADMDAFLDLAQRHNLFIIEDACQALGATYKGRPVGSIGHAGCISFFPTKNLGGYGDGGIVITNDEELARKIKLLASHGSTRRYYHDVIGYNSRLDALQAAILRIKLRRLNEWNNLRREKASFYEIHLKHTNLLLPYAHPEVSHVFHLYITQCGNQEQLAAHLKHAGISTGHYYPCPLHLQKAFAYLGYQPGDCTVAEKLSGRAIALPMFPELTDEQQEYIVKMIRQHV